MVICLERTISWQERLHAAAADCWRICIQHLLQMTVKQKEQDERAAVNQKAETAFCGWHMLIYII